MSITERAQSVLNGLFGANGGGNGAASGVVIQGEARRLAPPAERVIEPQAEQRTEHRTQPRGPAKRDDSKVVVVRFDKVTPKRNSYRFDTEDPNAPISNVYVQKEAFRRRPSSLTLTIESDGIGPLV